MPTWWTNYIKSITIKDSMILMQTRKQNKYKQVLPYLFSFFIYNSSLWMNNNYVTKILIFSFIIVAPSFTTQPIFHVKKQLPSHYKVLIFTLGFFFFNDHAKVLSVSCWFHFLFLFLDWASSSTFSFVSFFAPCAWLLLRKLFLLVYFPICTLCFASSPSASSPSLYPSLHIVFGFLFKKKKDFFYFPFCTLHLVSSLKASPHLFPYLHIMLRFLLKSFFSSSISFFAHYVWLLPQELLLLLY